MSWALGLLLLSLLNQGSGVHSLATLTQPASQSVSLGGTVTISCSGSSDGNWGTYFPWYEQKPGQAPRFLHCNGCNRGEGVPDRFSASRSGTTGSLTITDSQSEDEADYYCSEWDNTGKMFIFGGGTQLNILGQDPSPPKLSVYPPSPEEIKTKSTATLVCLVNDFYPGTVQVDWIADGTKVTQNVETAKPTKQGDKYASSSYLTLNKAEWERHNCFTCKVTHEGKSYEESIRPSQCRVNP